MTGKYDDHLAAITALEADAVPSEQLYLERLKRRYQQMNGVEIQSKGMLDETPDELRASVDMGYEGLHRYRYELEQADVDAHWSAFLIHQIAKYEGLLKPMLADLAMRGLEYHPPVFDHEKFERNERLNALQMELAGLEQLRSVTLAWAERHDALREVEQAINELSGKIMALQDHLQLKEPPQHV